MLIKKTKKLRQASRDELRVRAAQFLTILAERHGKSALTRLPTDEELFAKLDCTFGRENRPEQQLLALFRQRTKPKFFGSLTQPELTTQHLLNRLPTFEQRIIKRANNIVQGRFDLLGFRELDFGDPIDWHLEPVSRKRSPLLHWSRLNYLDSDVVGDKKIIWELNRHQYLVRLGQAYLLTHDERYAEVFVDHLNSWMDQNPPKVGINWASSLEVAFRSISWIWCFYFFRHSPTLTAATFLRALKFLYLHARHIETYLSTYFSPNTHLTGEALGLFSLGLMFPEFKEAERWKDVGSQILIDQLPLHVQADGVYFEQSSYYHRYTTDFYLHFLILARANDLKLPNEVEQALTTLLEHLMYITRPDGSTPFFGDDDGGRLTMLDCRPANDFRGTLATGAALLSRGDFKFVAGDACEQLLWLLGVEGLNRFDSLQVVEPLHRSKPFYQGGYYVMRDGWDREANYLLFDCGPHGTLNCGHAHADALSIDVAAHGRTVLVDPGTFTYTGSQELRNWFRGSQAHNTVVVDGKSSSQPAGPFSWDSVARTNLERWISTEEFDYVSGKHDGYERLQNPLAHSRSILFVKKNYWIVRDRLSSATLHKAQLRFQFDSTCRAEIKPTTGRDFVRELASELDIHCFAEGKTVSTVENGWVSRCYGERESAPAYVFTCQVTGESDVITFLVPQTSTQLEIREIETLGGRAFTITDKNNTDIVMIRTADRMECGRIVSDFEWLWGRFPTAAELKISRLLGINGKMVSIDGESVLNFSEPLDYLKGHRVSNELVSDTSKGSLTTPLPCEPFDRNALPILELA
jgi:heparinase II/III-like protein